MSKAGYGTTREILEMETTLVLYMAEYETFSADYQKAYMELNREQ